MDMRDVHDGGGSLRAALPHHARAGLTTRHLYDGAG